jgi:hypothetical protein
MPKYGGVSCRELFETDQFLDTQYCWKVSGKKLLMNLVVNGRGALPKGGKIIWRKVNPSWPRNRHPGIRVHAQGAMSFWW